MGISNRELAPDLRWPVFTRKSMAGFARELTGIRRIGEGCFRAEQKRLFNFVSAVHTLAMWLPERRPYRMARHLCLPIPD
mgnify:CR=1 FL=1